MHPTEEILVAVASGQADLPHRVMVEGHLDGCAACRAAVAEISTPGGALLESLPAVRPPDILWERLRARVGTLPQAGPALSPALAGLPLPEGARRELSETPGMKELRWRRMPAHPARYAVLLRDRLTGSALILGHMPPELGYPAHLHVGPEDILVLTGGFEDQFGAFETGAWASYAPGSQHRPVTEPGEKCWTLTRLETPNLYLGWRGWLQRLQR
ncbi:MAG: putative transcriptional regulator [Acidobacteriota bacterium]|jgi:putative transcriptional regulator|nr:putative transcriptional regulator [Acidobacteriota bacterium]